ncbi:BTB/POZ domain-containing protein 7 [Electrophorus electricus]|uniref:BTB domain-containing protein n=1 Tax=Electrophorus electricus TaxID=8005 RepID=A0A4W4FKX5_ELEEL|nr:BTB/POZ domain-containing protein 7 [Electrophorus electricus]XP_035379902.1 BTB/POZ domain-containing protein 7 [Electrophorus electricus]XP_035379903.1 BTB/POZ domain-containing protein 7 [Electrophorus electricus]
MGVNASSYPHSCSPRFGGHSHTQQTFIGTSYTPQGYGAESKLYSLEHGPEKPHDKKKKSSSLATLKRRFIKRRKSSRSADHARQMRELLSGWDVRDVNALVEEYEGTAALKELSMQAGLARPEARTLQQDLAALYQHKYCTDVDLIFQDACFPAHRAILVARCPFFKTLLSSSPGCGAEVLLDVGTVGMDSPMFSSLLYYLYTGELDDARLQNVDVLVRLREEFGTPNSLEADMRSLCEHMCYYDSLLSFSSDSELVEPFGASGPPAAGGSAGAEEELRAHKAVLSARSPFFRNLLQRRIRTGEEMTEHMLQAPTRIVLDESIIPRKYACVILHCMYTDTVDLSLVLCGSPSAGSLGEVQALVAGKGSMSRTEEAMELYHIALFLEFSMLAQGCEDIVVESISLDSVVAILKWSSQPYGSKWVHRQAMHFLCEEFSQVMMSDVLCDLSKEHLLSAIQSDYLQASEQDILKYVVKWGEHQLIKRMADREPNLLSGTAHSVNKRGVKRRDLDLEELKEILSPLLPCVRTEHILPTNSEVLSDTLKRGLISTPPSDMLPTAEGGKANAWLRQKSAGIYVRPRLFSPYVEEAKAVLDEMMVEQSDLVRLRMVRMSNVPDTLYMVNNAVPQCCHMISHQQMAGSQTVPPSVVANEIPVPRMVVVREMIRRLQELRHTDQVQRAYALNCGEGATVSYELQIRVLREFGLPDGAAELLQNPHKFFPEERFGDESPVLAMRQSGRCRVNSTPTVESMFTDLQALVGFHPPLPPPPPPYHPPTTPGHSQQQQLRAGWRPRVPSQQPPRSFSYPCNRSLLHRQPSSKMGSPIYPPGAKVLPPDCTIPQGRSLKQGNMEPVINEFMPDIAMGVSAMSLKDRRLPEVTMDVEAHEPHPHVSTAPSISHCYSTRHPHSSRKRHAAEPKANGPQPDFPDLYEFSGRHAPPYGGPDLYVHSRPVGGGALPPAYAAEAPDGLRLDVLEQPPQRLDLALVAQAAGAHAPHRPPPKGESDLTCGLDPSSEPYEEWATGRHAAAEGMGLGLSSTGTEKEGGMASRDCRSPNKQEYLYRKSAL